MWGYVPGTITFSSLQDVETVELTDGMVMRWNALDEKWVAVSLDLAGLEGVDTTAPQEGQVLVFEDNMWRPGEAFHPPEPLPYNFEPTLQSIQEVLVHFGFMLPAGIIIVTEDEQFIADENEYLIVLEEEESV